MKKASEKNGQEVKAAGAQETESPQAAENTNEQVSPEVEALQKQVQELTADLQRTRADFENFRKQVDLQREQAKQVAAAATVEKFLPLIDNVSRALQTYPEQLQPLTKSFTQTLQGLGLVEIDSRPGTEFNPDLHEAAMVEGEGAHEVIAETLRPGYMYDGQVLRAAMVKVKYVD